MAETPRDAAGPTRAREVRAGQEWAETAPQCAGRVIRIVRWDGTYAVAETVADLAKPENVGRRSQIRFDRFWPGPGNLRFVGEVTDGAR